MEINIIKSLLFLILIIFINEAYKNILKIKETGYKNIEAFSCETEKIKNNNPFLMDIKDDNTIDHSGFRSYRPNISQYGNRLYSIEEGHRRNEQDLNNIANIKKALVENEFLEPDTEIYHHTVSEENENVVVEEESIKNFDYNILQKRDKLENELGLQDWRNYVFKNRKTDGTQRLENDIITDYNPNIIGFQRRWQEYGTRNKIHQYYKNPNMYFKQYDNYYN
jgi:hypothetical protein